MRGSLSKYVSGCGFECENMNGTNRPSSRVSGALTLLCSWLEYDCSQVPAPIS